MSASITENMVQQFGTNFRILGQQRKSRLERWCQSEPNIVGTGKTVERLGASEAYDLTSRHADTQYVENAHSRRWLDLGDKAWADLVDEMDKIKMLADPTSPYVSIGRAALNRKRDDAIIAAASGNARTDSASIALPAAQKVAASATGLTLAKLNATREILDASEIDNAEDETGQATVNRVMVVTTKQLSDLLNTTEIKSVDYNSVKALVQGQVDTFMGFKFVRTERLVADGSGDRSCLAWIKGCVAFGWGMDQHVSIDPLPGKNYSVQVYARESVGATRIEDAGVVELACVEA